MIPGPWTKEPTFVTNVETGLPVLPRASQRVHDLLGRMTLEEKRSEATGTAPSRQATSHRFRAR